MITEQELQISNISYTDKDFASIYPELLELVKNLTKKWDPTTSNESDPGVVLLKLLAFMGDKLNYNIDKNILERFMPSATQETSMRELCDMLGYEMNYYIAPSTKVVLRYTGDESDFKINPFEVVLGNNEDTSVKFTIVDSLNFSNNTLSDTNTLYAIRGEVKSLQVANKDIITLENLDDNNRIYFPTTNVAQNGVFIWNKDDTPSGNPFDEQTTFWKKVQFLNLQTPRQYVYKFGFDSKRGLPYVEFPEDIANIIKDGVCIKYVTTNGASDNIPANYLNTVNTISGHDNLNTEDFVVSNGSSTINGKDKESIEEAYNNFKKTIGTFDTLVTCRDYANAIYNLIEGSTEEPLVSNVQVSDRRDDINFGRKVVTYGEYGTTYDYNYATEDTNALKANELCLYTLKPTREILDEYNRSFEPLLNTKNIQNYIENSKTVSHDYREFTDTDNTSIFLIRNDLILNARLTTTAKVNNYVRKEINTNVKNALAKKFNSRNIDYGYEIPYDVIINTIKQADNRIKYVDLPEPELNTKIVTPTSTISLIDGTNYTNYAKIVAQNVLNGKLSLFESLDAFTFEFGQRDGRVLNAIESFTSHANIELTSGTSYTLQENEIIQVISPNVVDSITYSLLGTYYELSEGLDIPANSYYKLGASQYINLYQRKDANSEFKKISFTNGDIIHTTGRLYVGGSSKNITYQGSEITVQVPSSSADTIAKGSINQVTLEKPFYCYWLLNNADNKIPFDGNGEYILNEGEYFFYTSNAKDTFNMLGSGTSIKISDVGTWNTLFNDKTIPKISLEEASSGINALSKYWEYINFTSTFYLDIVENTILTLQHGDSCTWTGTNSPITLTNNFEVFNFTDFTYVINGEEKVLSTYNISDISWKIKSRLDLNASDTIPQKLYQGQSIEFVSHDTITLSASATDNVLLNAPLVMVGGENVSVSSIELDDSGNIEPTYPLNIYVYKGETTITRDVNNISSCVLSTNSSSETYVLPTISIKNTTEEEPLAVNLMYYIIPTQSSDTVELTVSSGTVLKTSDISSSSMSGSTSITLAKGLNNITILAPVNSPSTPSFNITLAMSDPTTEDIKVNFDIPKYVEIKDVKDKKLLTLNKQINLDGYASLLDDLTGVDENNVKINLYDKILSQVKDIGTSSSEEYFYYNNKIQNAKVINEEYLTSPYAFFDYNNMANKFTLCKIDFDHSNIDVVKSSRL